MINIFRNTKSIASKIFIYMIIFSLSIVGVIGFGTKFILPSYYFQKQISYLEASEERVKIEYESNSEGVITIMEEMKSQLGGELYYFDESSGSQGLGMGKGKNRAINSNSEKFVASGDISIYTYKNKVGLDIYVLGVLIEDQYLVYEVEIQKLNRAISTMMDFIIILLVISLILAIIISYILSRTISKPIKKLNSLAQSMKSRDIETYMVTEDKDEIRDLNQSLNELYEELKGTIYKLNSELNKERNSEMLKKRFLAQATHELKTPIAVISGYAEILYDGMYKDQEERDRFLKNIYDESKSVSHLILDVLDYTKMETGNYKLKLSRVGVKDFINSMFKRYDDYIGAKGIDFSYKEDIPLNFEKSMDRDRYEQIYKNLISNAVEHAKSKITTEISLIGSKLKLSVYNDGKNISEEDLPNVFESFYKTKGKRSGTGLGLAIVKEIVLLHGGEYRVINHEDGVEFIILI